ncbi:hypothetical protein ACFSTH_20145 [Paenibacillus yanchengensis]|uniref:Uncharacterized protein n=1 Tax=Paenibacillus yanchengensis TaxID=2035833 RepID=A0ABW4YMH8_9BACL
MAESCPSYFRPSFDLKSLNNASFVMYSEAQHVTLSSNGTALGDREDAYFNRDLFKFFSHQHTPSTMEAAGIGMAQGPDGIYIAWELFSEYADKGSLHVKEMIVSWEKY